jgi:HAMP domain-containing protein
LDGVRRVYGFVAVPLSDARLVVGFPEAEVLNRIDREIQLAYLQLAFFAILVLIIAWIGGERLVVDPIRSLARTATRLGRGDLTARPERQRWAKEFAPLATALREMAQKLAEREGELRSANEHLEQLALIDPLSGLANRRNFDETLARTWREAIRHRRRRFREQSPGASVGGLIAAKRLPSPRGQVLMNVATGRVTCRRAMVARNSCRRAQAPAPASSPSASAVEHASPTLTPARPGRRRHRPRPMVPLLRRPRLQSLIETADAALRRGRPQRGGRDSDVELAEAADRHRPSRTWLGQA